MRPGEFPVGVRPGKYALGSGQSRAAARILLEQRRRTEKRRTVILCIGGLEAPSVGDPQSPGGSVWSREPDGTQMRTIWLPGGADMAECLRQVGGFKEEEMAQIAAHDPIVPEFEIMTLEC